MGCGIGWGRFRDVRVHGGAGQDAFHIRLAGGQDNGREKTLGGGRYIVGGKGVEKRCRDINVLGGGDTL